MSTHYRPQPWQGLSQQSFKHSAATKGDNSVSLWERAHLGTATLASSSCHGSGWCHCSEVSADSQRSRHFNLSVPAALQPPSKHSKTQTKPCCDGGTGSAGRENPAESDIERQVTQPPIIALHGDLPHSKNLFPVCLISTPAVQPHKCWQVNTEGTGFPLPKAAHDCSQTSLHPLHIL